jgi:hypothetical protein
MPAAYVNEDGLTIKYGSYYQDARNFANVPRAIAGKGGTVKELVIDYDLALLGANGVSYTTDLNNDGTRDGFNHGDTGLPAFASVTRVTLLVTEAAAGGTSIKLGTFLLNGTAVSDNSLITATEGVLANLDTKGARVYGAGALVAATAETASVGANDVYLALTVAGTFTAGKGRILIEYIDPLGDV